MKTEFESYLDRMKRKQELFDLEATTEMTREEKIMLIGLVSDLEFNINRGQE